MIELLKGPMFRLNIVIMSSLALLAFGLRTPVGTIEVLQLPVAFMQVYFISAVLLQAGWQGFVAPLTRIQLGLVAMIVLYVALVSLTSSAASAKVLVLSWLVHIFFFLASVTFFRTASLDDMKNVWLAMGLTASIHVIAFLFAWAAWPDEIRQMNLPAVGNVRHLGYFLSPIAALMAVGFLTYSNKPVLSLVFFSATAFFLAYTGSRGGFIAVLIGSLWAGVYARKQITRWRVGVLLGVTMTLIVATEALPRLPWGTILTSLFDVVSQPNEDHMTGRYEIWVATVKLIKESWAWGYGPALLKDVSDEMWWLYQPHNGLLQFLLHWGTVGTVLFIMTAASFSSQISSTLRSYPRLAVMPLAIIVSTLVHSLVAGSLFYPFSVVNVIIASAVLIAFGKPNHDGQEPNWR